MSGRDWPTWLQQHHVAELRELEQLAVSCTGIAIALHDDELRAGADELDGLLGWLKIALERSGLCGISEAVQAVQKSAQALGDAVRVLSDEVGS